MTLVKGFALTHLSTLEAMLEGGDAASRAPKEKRSWKRRCWQSQRKGKEIVPHRSLCKNEYNTLGALSLKVYSLIY